MMTQTLALSIGLPVAYVIVGAIVARCVYTYAYRRQTKTDRDINTTLSFIVWPLAGLGFGIYYFVTNGVRKQNKTSGRAS